MSGPRASVPIIPPALVEEISSFSPLSSGAQLIDWEAALDMQEQNLHELERLLLAASRTPLHLPQYLADARTSDLQQARILLDIQRQRVATMSAHLDSLRAIEAAAEAKADARMNRQETRMFAVIGAIGLFASVVVSLIGVAASVAISLFAK